jgi:hypothetical protein
MPPPLPPSASFHELRAREKYVKKKGIIASFIRGFRQQAGLPITRCDLLHPELLPHRLSQLPSNMNQKDCISDSMLTLHVRPFTWTVAYLRFE